MAFPEHFEWRANLGSRDLFPELEPIAYLNHAAISPSSIAVRSVVADVSQSYAQQGIGAFSRWLDQREGLRARLATLFGATADDIGFTANTTSGVVDVALCFPWQRGDRIICFEGDFPTNVTPWQRAAALFDLTVEMLPMHDFGEPDGPDFAALDRALDRGARVVAISAVQFQTGLTVPLAEIGARCRAAGAALFVDAIQACGVVPVDVERDGIDFLACGSHKWLMGHEGCGFLYVRPQWAAKLRPHVAGWMSHEAPFAFLFEGPGELRYDRPIRARADFVEGGAPNVLGLAALDASVRLIEQLGISAIFEHVQRWHDAVEPDLVELGFRSCRAPDAARRSGVLSFEPPPRVTAAALAAAVGERGISCAMPDGLVRLAPHWPNSIEEAPRVVEAFAAALGR